MTSRAILAGIVLALIGLCAAPPALAAAAHPTYSVDLTLSYLAAEPPPDPDFVNSSLTGEVQFWYQVIAPFDTPLLPPGPPIDIGRLGVGDSFTIHFIPPGPCFSAGACNLFFKFGGDAAGFPARAEPPGPPIDNPDLVPAVQFPILDANGLPAVQSGPIYAFDAPVQVGDWRTVVRTTGVPEPGAWALLLLGFAGAGLALRRSPRRLPA